MKLLIITDVKKTMEEKELIAKQFTGSLYAGDIDGLSTKEIEEVLFKSDLDDIFITSDTRFLRHVRKNPKLWQFDLDVLVVVQDDRWAFADDLTKRILRDGHNIMKLYESGEFQFSEDRGVKYNDIY